MSDLMPCPFCGAEASFKPRSFKASCDRCGAHVPNGAVSSDEAIAAWSTRTVQAQIDAAVAAERERCAKVAETCPDSHWGPWVAAAIRNGGPAMTDTPNPGSREAVAEGCTSPVLDNRGGKGLRDDREEFWVSYACPLHGFDAEDGQ